ncbi:MAG TPA: ATP-binding protein [Candidatus Obscuribacterales bacterium]
MHDDELVALMHDLESDLVERKEAFTDPDRVRQAICAYANDLPRHGKPGVIYIGVKDDGSCANLPITDELLIKLANLRSDGNILPFPVITVEKRVLDGCSVAVIIVEPSQDPPVRARGQVWIRVGPRRAIATREEEQRLTERRRAANLPFDIREAPTASLEDLDIDLFQRTYLPAALPEAVLEQNQRTVSEQLASMRMATAAKTPRPTVLGVLVLGIDPRQYVPNSYIQFLRIDGTELSDPITDQKEIDGAIPDLLRALDMALEAHISVATDLTGSVEVHLPDYPLPSLQQVTRNAVLHRSYEGTNAPVRIYWFSDRIEIQSPGGPFGQVNRENFGKPGVTDYRNPHLAEAMKNLGYVQRFGIGIQIAKRELEKNGNPPLEFQVEETQVLAIMRRRLP